MKVLYIGPFPAYGKINTTLLRFQVFNLLFNHPEFVDTNKQSVNLCYRIKNRLYRMGFSCCLPDKMQVNEEIKDKIERVLYDVIWIDKGLLITSSILEYIKRIQPQTVIIGYSPDLMTARHNQSQQFVESLPYYDCYVTTKSYAVADMYKLGCKKVIYQGNAFQEDFHYPREILSEDYNHLGGEVGFIGAWEKERAESILYLVQNNIPVRVWGAGKWLNYRNKYPLLQIENESLFTDDYCKALSAFKISLCFLRKINFDQQTTRTVEIPACQGFMLAERTQEHLDMFEEDKEACYFSSNEELLAKCQYYLEHENERIAIAKAGRQRCIDSGYSYKERIISVFKELSLM